MVEVLIKAQELSASLYGCIQLLRLFLATIKKLIMTLFWGTDKNTGLLFIL